MNRFIGVLIFLLSIVCFIISVDVFYIQAILLTNIILAWEKYLEVTSIFIWSGFDSSFRRFSASSPVLECSPRRNRDDYKKHLLVIVLLLWSLW